MRAVNLLPRQQIEQKRERPNTVVFIAGIGGAAVVLVLVAGFLLANRSVDRQRQALSTARAVLAATPDHHVSAQTNAFRSAILSQREQRTLALAAAIGKRVAWDRILREISLVLPSDVWLTAMTLNAPGTGQGLSINGSTYSHDSVARLLSRLGVVPDLSNIQLQHSQFAHAGTHGLVSFTIIADLRAPGATS